MVNDLKVMSFVDMSQICHLLILSFLAVCHLTFVMESSDHLSLIVLELDLTSFVDASFLRILPTHWSASIAMESLELLLLLARPYCSATASLEDSAFFFFAFFVIEATSYASAGLSSLSKLSYLSRVGAGMTFGEISSLV